MANPVAAILADTSCKNKKVVLVRKDGACSWLDTDGVTETVWRKGDPTVGVLSSAAWRPFSGKRSIIALGFLQSVVLCEFSANGGDVVERHVYMPFRPDILSWSPNGRILFVASSTSNVILTIDAAFGIIDGKLQLVGRKNTILSLEWAKSGYCFVSGSSIGVSRLYKGDAMVTDEVFLSRGPLHFGGWSRDGLSYVCGSKEDGLCMTDTVKKAQWVLVTPEDLAQIAIEAGCGSSFSVKKIACDPTCMDLLIVVLSGLRTEIVGFRVVRTGKNAMVNRVEIGNAPKASPSLVAFHPFESGSVFLCYPDGSFSVVKPERR